MVEWHHSRWRVQAGLPMQLRGGNAVDAAIAAITHLPRWNRLAMASGLTRSRSGTAVSCMASMPPGRRLAAGPTDSQAVGYPIEDWETVTVPGAVAGWATGCTRKLGKLRSVQAVSSTRQNGFIVSR
jgi:gamma-glutamyltranspeptidase